MESKYGPLFVCDKYVITFGMIIKIIGFFKFSHAESMDRYPLETKKNSTKVMNNTY